MTDNRELPQFILDMIASFPRVGEGLHFYLFRLCRQLHAHRTEEEMFALLRALCNDAGGRVPDKKIRDAIKNSKDCAWRPSSQDGSGAPVTAESPRPHKPARQYERIDELVRKGPSLIDLWETSPVRFSRDASSDEPAESHTEQIIDVAFPGNPLLCVAKTHGTHAGDFATRRREVWRGRLSQCALIVPSPRLKVWGMTQEGNRSQHAMEACGPRRFLTVEFDFSEFAKDEQTETEWSELVREWKADGISVADACAALLWHLAEYGPLSLVVHSGGKSLHGWFYCEGRTEEQLWPFMEYAYAIGADAATRCPNQFVRMPDGVRPNGRRQPVYYFNPEAVKS